jgi:hypothetical protein
MAAPNPMPCPHCSGKKPEASTPAGVGLRAVTPGPALFLMDGTFFNLQFFITTHDLLLHHLRSIISGSLMTCTFGSSNFSRNFTRTVKSSRTHVLLWGHDESEASVAGSGVKFVFFFTQKADVIGGRKHLSWYVQSVERQPERAGAAVSVVGESRNPPGRSLSYPSSRVKRIADAAKRGVGAPCRRGQWHPFSSPFSFCKQRWG